MASSHTLRPTRLGAGIMSTRRSGSTPWLTVVSVLPWPMSVPSPMVMPPVSLECAADVDEDVLAQGLALAELAVERLEDGDRFVHCLAGELCQQGSHVLGVRYPVLGSARMRRASCPAACMAQGQVGLAADGECPPAATSALDPATTTVVGSAGVEGTDVVRVTVSVTREVPS